MSTVRTMCCRATMRRPLRSKRARISPVRPRANASGLTRMRVRSTEGGSLREWLRWVRRAGTLRARLADRGRLGEVAGPAAAAAPRLRRHARDLGLAERADLPRGIQRLGAG